MAERGRRRGCGGCRGGRIRRLGEHGRQRSRWRNVTRPRSAASGSCSRATARQLVERLGLSISDPLAESGRRGSLRCRSPVQEARPWSVTLRGTRDIPGVAELGGLPLGRRHVAAPHEAARGRIDHCRRDLTSARRLPIYRPADSRCCPTRWHEDAHLALERHALRGRPLEAGSERRARSTRLSTRRVGTSAAGCSTTAASASVRCQSRITSAER